MIAHELCSYYEGNYEVKETDEVIRRVFPNAEYYAEKYIFDELKVLAFIPCAEDKDYRYEINGKKYGGVWTSSYSKLLDSYIQTKNKLIIDDYKKNENKQISLFDLED